MSGFYNKKEEVIEIQLTQYGKELLAKGKFKPSHYAFFDDDVLYDVAYAESSEAQNESQDRILENTPRLKTQYVYSSIEDSVYKNVESVRSGEESIRSEIHRQVPASDYAFSAPLGNSKYTDEYAPAWSIIPLVGDISVSRNTKSGLFPTQNVPLLSMQDLEYKTKIIKRDTSGSPDGFGSLTDYDGVEPHSSGSIIVQNNDGTSDIKITNKEVLLQIAENNAPLEKDNFEIEFFIIEDVPDAAAGGTREKLTPLNITTKTKNNIVNGVLLDAPLDVEVPVIDSSYVEYYLNISTDSEIDNSELCRLIDKYENKDEYYNNQELGCRTGSDRSTASKKVYGVDTSIPEEDC